MVGWAGVMVSVRAGSMHLHRRTDGWKRKDWTSARTHARTHARRQAEAGKQASKRPRTYPGKQGICISKAILEGVQLLLRRDVLPWKTPHYVIAENGGGRGKETADGLRCVKMVGGYAEPRVELVHRVDLPLLCNNGKIR